MKASGGRASLAIAIVSVVFAAVTLVLAIVLFNSSVGRYELAETYGGDAYTGIQNAAAQTANNVQATNEILVIGFGGILLVAAFAFTLISIHFFHKAALQSPARYPSAPAPVKQPTPAYPPAPTRAAEPQKNDTFYWVCDCGMKNSSTQSVCRGCQKTRASKVGNPDYGKCLCGAQVKHQTKCPLCGRMVR